MTNFAGGDIFTASVAGASTCFIARRKVAIHSLAGGMHAC
jgi:hypothetical protein